MLDMQAPLPPSSGTDAPSLCALWADEISEPTALAAGVEVVVQHEKTVQFKCKVKQET